MAFFSRSRAVWRLLRVIVHLLEGLLTVGLIYTFCSDTRKLALKQRWSAKLLHMLGITLKVIGKKPKSGFLVSNHISFIDIFAINAWMPSSFVAKDDIRHWPLIGWLSKHTDTLFIERGNRRAAQRTSHEMSEQFKAGKRVVVFPEGTTSNGDKVLHFHTALFQAAIDAHAEVTPLAMRYQDREGRRSYAAAFVGDMNLLQCFWSIACSEGINVTLSALPPLTTETLNRRHIAHSAHDAIQQALTPHVA